MLPLSRTLFSTYNVFIWLLCQSCAIHPHISNIDLFTYALHSVFDGITHAWHLLLAFIVLELYLVTDVRIYPLNRTS